MARIEDLKGLVSKGSGIAKGNIYRVFLPSMPGATSREINLLCSNVNLPGRQIMTQERKIGTIMQKVAYDQAYDDVNMTFLLLNDYGIKNYFESWQALALDPNTLEPNYHSEYTFDVKIQQLKRGFTLPIYNTPLGLPILPAEIQNRLPKIGSLDLAQGELDIDLPIFREAVVYECTLEKAFCTTMSAVELGNAMGDVMQLQIQLSYKNWRSNFTPSKPTVTNNLIPSASGAPATSVRPKSRPTNVTKPVTATYPNNPPPSVRRTGTSGPY